MALAITSLAAPAYAQIQGSEGEKFLKAVEEGDSATAIPLAEVPGAYVVNYKGYSGNTALHIATRKRELEWVGFLLTKGADPNIGDTQGDTPLIIAARIGFDDAADYMLRMGANPDATNRRGDTALIVAVQQNRQEIVKLLMKAGADPDKSDYSAGYSARDYAKRDTRNRNLLKLIETIRSDKKTVARPGL
ncbi:MAG: ankyrin repeat domain-containing protein [Sphingomicrobium sp.]